MKQIRSKVLATTLAASVLIGGGVAALLQTQAYADTTDGTSGTTPPAAGAKNHGGPGKGAGFDKRGGQGDELSILATSIGISAEELQTQLKAGKTVLQLAEEKGITKASLLEKLNAAFAKSIDDAVAAGALTQEQATKRKDEITARSEHLVTNLGLPPGGQRMGPGQKGGQGGPGHGGGGPGGRGGMMGGGPGLGIQSEAIAGSLGMTVEELRAAQQAGKSLSEIAQEKGITEDSLIGKLKDGLTDQLKKFVQQKRTPGAEPKQPEGQRGRPDRQQAPTTGGSNAPARSGGAGGSGAATAQSNA
ncbi:hypothetical protein [Paenibacillus koleovorans]|uniref:hypothetical protein n=1 Tax=Paenibacillus koleovorans TaxID=121608 RepID=UPI000FD80408|nr:hypothetical protein [Paenibacillus koleovorans]